MSIKNIVFDFGGVLVDFTPERMIKDCNLSDYRELVLDKVFGSEYWQDMDRGALSVEQAIENMLVSLPECIHENVRRMILDKEEQMPPLKDMTPIIDSLHEAGYRLFVLSNCAKWLHDFIKNVPHSEYFEAIFISADYLINKPDYRLFNIFLDKFTLKAEECFFIDDSPKNIQAAKELGFKTHCFKERNFEQLKKEISLFNKE